jgi:hypothetical protein
MTRGDEDADATRFQHPRRRIVAAARPVVGETGYAGLPAGNRGPSLMGVIGRRSPCVLEVAGVRSLRARETRCCATALRTYSTVELSAGRAVADNESRQGRNAAPASCRFQTAAQSRANDICASLSGPPFRTTSATDRRRTRSRPAGYVRATSRTWRRLTRAAMSGRHCRSRTAVVFRRGVNSSTGAAVAVRSAVVLCPSAA